MENKYTKLVDASNRFNEAVQKFGKTLQLVKEQVKEHNDKYKYLYANENHIPRKKIIE